MANRRMFKTDIPNIPSAAPASSGGGSGVFSLIEAQFKDDYTCGGDIQPGVGQRGGFFFDNLMDTGYERFQLEFMLSTTVNDIEIGKTDFSFDLPPGSVDYDGDSNFNLRATGTVSKDNIITSHAYGTTGFNKPHTAGVDMWVMRMQLEFSFFWDEAAYPLKKAAIGTCQGFYNNWAENDLTTTQLGFNSYIQPGGLITENEGRKIRNFFFVPDVFHNATSNGKAIGSYDIYDVIQSCSCKLYGIA